MPARLSRVDRPAGIAARLRSAPPCFFTCRASRASTTLRWYFIQVAAGHQVIGQVASLVLRPGLEGGDELDLVDQSVLQG